MNNSHKIQKVINANQRQGKYDPALRSTIAFKVSVDVQ